MNTEIYVHGIKVIHEVLHWIIFSQVLKTDNTSMSNFKALLEQNDIYFCLTDWN